MKLNWVPYAYVHNLQGDIIAIVDGNGNKVVEYKYDAWGKPVAKTGTMANALGIIPFDFLVMITSIKYSKLWEK